MSKNAFDYIEDKEKVLVNKGDLFMLMHTLVAYFGCNKAPVEFTIDCLQSICRRNMYPKTFVDEFIDFQGKMIDESTSKEIDERLENMGSEKIEESVNDVYKWLNGEDQEENNEKKEEQDNE